MQTTRETIWKSIRLVLDIMTCVNIRVTPDTNETVGSDYGEGSGDIIRAQWMCEGWENNLIQCHKPPPTTTCDHSMDAGVRCYGECTIIHLLK